MPRGRAPASPYGEQPSGRRLGLPRRTSRPAAPASPQPDGASPPPAPASSIALLTGVNLKFQPSGSGVATLFRENTVEICGLFCFFLIIPLMFAFVYNWLPTVVMLVIFACFLVALTPLFSGASLLAGNLTGSVIITTIAGLHFYHALLMPLASLQHGRTYSGVYASQPSAAYSDAALLRFAANATVDGSKTLGMTTLEGGVATYCVAPVVDSQSTNRAEYWAIGLDCCGKHANFNCGEAGVAGVHAGYVVEDARDADVWFDVLGKHFTPSLYRRDLFMQAVQLAESVHGVASSPQPVMVSWSSKSRGGLVPRLWLRLIVFVVALLACMLIAAVILSPMLKQVGVKMEAQAVVSEIQREEDVELMDFQHVVMQGFVLPFVSFVLCVLLTSWSHCFRFGGVLAAMLELALAGVALALLASKWSFRHGILLIFTITVAVYVGHLNFVYNTFPYCSIQARRSYSGVGADVKPAEVLDAGRLHFLQNATVGVNQSVGFRYRGINYCAAPVLTDSCAAATAAPSAAAVAAAPAAPAPAPAAAAGAGAACAASVWAVGVDCCGPRGGFSCGGPDGNGLVGQAPHGAVLHDLMEFGIHDEFRRNYLMAVNASASLHNLLVPAKPMLVKVAQQTWELDQLVQEFKGTAIGVSLLAVALTFLVLTGIAFAWINLGNFKVPRVFNNM